MIVLFCLCIVSIVMHVMKMKTYSSLEDLLADVMGVSILTVTSTPEQGQASATASMIVQTAAGEEDIAVFLKMRRAGTRAEEWDRAFGLYRYRVFGVQYRVFGLQCRRELVMYRDVLPLLDRFTQATSSSALEFGRMFPRFYGAGLYCTVLYCTVLYYSSGSTERGCSIWILCSSSRIL